LSLTGRLRVDPVVRATFPAYEGSVLYARGLSNGPGDSCSRERLAQAAATAREAFADSKPTDHPEVKAWRDAYSTFRAKPSRYPSSIESLLKRVLGGQDPPEVNKLVDLYNAVSLEYVLPIGGEDWDNLVGPGVLRFAAGDEVFIDLNHDDQTHPRPGEVVWADDAGVTCRRWNWRQCARTQLTERTRNAYFLLESLGGDAERLEAATQALRSTLESESPTCDIEIRTLP
jgi:DNA/RNA-binding domain of Phe-tRNA-synthetase-like protein